MDCDYMVMCCQTITGLVVTGHSPWPEGGSVCLSVVLSCMIEISSCIFIQKTKTIAEIQETDTYFNTLPSEIFRKSFYILFCLQIFRPLLAPKLTSIYYLPHLHHTRTHYLLKINSQKVWETLNRISSEPFCCWEISTFPVGLFPWSQV
jgi:hypothetical protein